MLPTHLDVATFWFCCYRLLSFNIGFLCLSNLSLLFLIFTFMISFLSSFHMFINLCRPGGFLNFIYSLPCMNPPPHSFFSHSETLDFYFLTPLSCLFSADWGMSSGGKPHQQMVFTSRLFFQWYNAL